MSVIAALCAGRVGHAVETERTAGGAAANELPEQREARPASARDSVQVTAVIGSLTSAEGGPAETPPSPLTAPFGIDFDARGTLYVVELEGGRVFQQAPTGKLLRIAGGSSSGYSGDGGPAADARFHGMHNVAVTPAGDVYIADSWNHCIRRIDATTRVISTFAGTGVAGFSGDGGPANMATFDYLMCITFDRDCRRLYLADINNRRIRVIDMHTRIVTTVAGNGERGVPADGAIAVQSPLVDPRAVAIDAAENIYVLERTGHALRVVNRDGQIRTVVGNGEPGAVDGPADRARLNEPKHLCVDDHDNVYIADDQNASIRKYDPRQRTLATILGHATSGQPIRLQHPHGVCVEKGALYVVDTGNNRILRMKL